MFLIGVINPRKGKVHRNHRRHSENSSHGFIEPVDYKNKNSHSIDEP